VDPFRFRYRRSGDRREERILKDGVVWSPASSVADADGSISAHSDGSEDGPREAASSQPHLEREISELEATQNDEDTSNWRRHSPLGVRSWRFTPSPLQEEHRRSRTARGSTPLVIATPQVIARLQRQAEAEAGPVSPVPMRPRARSETLTASESRAARHSGRDPRSSNTSRDPSTRLSTGTTDTAGIQFDRRTPEDRFGTEQQDQPPDSYGVLEGEHRQFAQVRSSARRPHANTTPTQDASRNRIHDRKGSDSAFGKQRSSSRRRAQESRESADGPARRRSRHWSEVPEWRP
jgi:hypothetical protein